MRSPEEPVSLQMAEFRKTLSLSSGSSGTAISAATGDWRPETAREKTAQIEFDLISKFGTRNLESIDKFELQTHVNHLARTYCQDRVKQARSYLKSIFDEAMEQEFLVKDPTRTLKIPRNLRLRINRF